MRKHSMIRWTASRLFIVALALVPAATAAQEGRSARVTFADGESIDVSGVTFTYEWITEYDSRFINPTINKRSADVLHYTETIRSTTLDRSVALANIQRMTIQYPSESNYCGAKLTVSSPGGTAQALSRETMSLPPAPDDPITKPQFYGLTLSGTASVAGQIGKFEGRLYGARCPSKQEAIIEVAFR